MSLRGVNIHTVTPSGTRRALRLGLPDGTIRKLALGRHRGAYDRVLSWLRAD